jgi:hypothetical protein
MVRYSGQRFRLRLRCERVSVRVELCETAATPDGTHIRKKCGFVLALRMLRTSILGCVCIFPAYMQIRENEIAKEPYFGGRILSSILALGLRCVRLPRHRFVRAAHCTISTVASNPA